MWWWIKKIIYERHECKPQKGKKRLFSSTLSRLLLWPLQDVLINNLRNVRLKYFFLLLEISFIIITKLRNVDEGRRKTLIQFYEFMNLRLALRTKGKVENLWMKFVRDFFIFAGARRSRIKYTQLCKLIFIIRNTRESGKYVFYKNPLSASQDEEEKNHEREKNFKLIVSIKPSFWILFLFSFFIYIASKIRPDFYFFNIISLMDVHCRLIK